MDQKTLWLINEIISAFVKIKRTLKSFCCDEKKNFFFWKKKLSINWWDRQLGMCDFDFFSWFGFRSQIHKQNWVKFRNLHKKLITWKVATASHSLRFMFILQVFVHKLLQNWPWKQPYLFLFWLPWATKHKLKPYSLCHVTQGS